MGGFSDGGIVISEDFYDPIVDKITGKYSAISLTPFLWSSFNCRAEEDTSRLIGYVNESPLVVLNKVFRNYRVSNIGGYRLLVDLTQKDLPLNFLNILPVEPVFGMGGDLSDFLKIEEAVSAQRSRPISKKELASVVQDLKMQGPYTRIDSEFRQQEFEKSQIIDYLKKLRR